MAALTVKRLGLGVWRWGNDFSNGAARVIAVYIGSDEYSSMDWIGPMSITDETAGLLEGWARSHREMWGGCVHLLPCDGDARQELEEWWGSHGADDEDDPTG
jgi:hypothetical protein